jgi:hypothetical protein
MILWTLITIFLVVMTLLEAEANDWGLPEYHSIATLAALWFIGSLALVLVSMKSS